MTDAAVTDSLPATASHESLVARAAVPVAYAALGLTLLWSRLADLGKGFWFDESYFVAHFVRKGPREIITGPSLSHELYGVLAWATGELVGESELAYRLLSVAPFLAGVVLVTAWLHVRVNPGSGLLYLFLATVSPLLLDITRQARGYGLAFLAMSVVIVAALEADRTRRTLPVAVMCVAGVLGAWTLPQVAIGFLATGAVLLLHRALRWQTLVGLLAAVLAIYLWYAPHSGQVQAAAQYPDGRKIETAWLVTAPIDQILLPALLWIEGVVFVPGALSLVLVGLVALVIAASPFVRERGPALILASGPVAAILVLWIGQAYVIPRYLSFLLVPLFVLVATGGSSILGGVTRREATARGLVCVAAIAALTLNFAHVAPRVVRLPKEATRDAARVIETQAGPTTPVLTRLHLPESLVFYLGRPVQPLGRTNAASRICESRVEVAYVAQPFLLEPVDVPCLARTGVRHFRLRQYARGGAIDVWLVPPR
jgi:MFS family permease